MVFIENEGALFKGPSRGNPTHVWSRRAKDWRPYTGRVPKPIEWGYEIGEDEARQMMGEDEARPAVE